MDTSKKTVKPIPKKILEELDQVARHSGFKMMRAVGEPGWYFTSGTPPATSPVFTHSDSARSWLDGVDTGRVLGVEEGTLAERARQEKTDRPAPKVELMRSGNSWFVWVSRRGNTRERLDHERLPAVRMDTAAQVALEVVGGDADFRLVDTNFEPLGG
jgi:ketosteroid isomerase-like protein